MDKASFATSILDPDTAPRPAFVLTDRHGPTRGYWHAHRRAQLIHAAEGVLIVRAECGLWVVPPERAIWMPAGQAHLVASRRPHALLTLYVEPDWLPLPDASRVVAIDRLVEELLQAAAVFGSDYPPGGPEERLVRVILDRLPTLTTAPLHLPQPKSPALRRITEALTSDPANAHSLDEWCEVIGMTPRTATRRFAVETGMTFGRWRQQLRLLIALERLGEGRSVTEVALDIGYEDTSAFIAVFKRAFGTTPSRYFAQGSSKG